MSQSFWGQNLFVTSHSYKSKQISAQNPLREEIWKIFGIVEREEGMKQKGELSLGVWGWGQF